MSDPQSHHGATHRRSRWPYGIIGALAFVVSAQAAMIAIASNNPPVLESETAYADSLRYDDVVDARRASAALGWTAAVEVTADAVVYTVTDAAGAPVAGLSGGLRMARPDTRAADAEVAFAEVAPGVYRAPRAAGAGVFRLSARLAGGPSPWLDERRAVFQ